MQKNLQIIQSVLDCTIILQELLKTRVAEDLSFMKGDLMYIINDSDGDWWFARKKDGGEEGYVPSNYVTDYMSDLHAKK